MTICKALNYNISKSARFNEETTKFKFINQWVQASWDIKEISEVFMEYPVPVSTNRKKDLVVDYVLGFKVNGNLLALALMEAKPYYDNVYEGLEQGKNHGELIGCPFIFTSNGQQILEFDSLTSKTRILSMNELPYPHELWDRYLKELDEIQGFENVYNSEDESQNIENHLFTPYQVISVPLELTYENRYLGCVEKMQKMARRIIMYNHLNYTNKNKIIVICDNLYDCTEIKPYLEEELGYSHVDDFEVVSIFKNNKTEEDEEVSLTKKYYLIKYNYKMAMGMSYL